MLTIGQLAATSGVPTSTIRFWERRGLLRPATRSGGQRRYDADALTQVGVLRLCQDAGFTLAEIHEMMDSRAGWRDFVEAKMVDVADSLAKLGKAYQILSHARDCEYEDIAQCPKFQAAVAHRAGHVTANGLPELAE